MSTKETPLTRRYWERVVGRGTLLEECCVVRPRPGVSPRWIDGVIILGGEHRIASKAEHGSLNGHDVVVVQTKRGRFGMYLLGQALFSRELIREHFRRGPYARSRYVAVTMTFSTRSPRISGSRSRWTSLFDQKGGIGLVESPR